MDAPTPARQRRQRIDGSFGAAELSLTRARNLAGPTFSLLIGLSQANRWRWLSRAGDLDEGAALELAFVNPSLLAAHEPAYVGGVADIKKRGDQQE